MSRPASNAADDDEDAFHVLHPKSEQRLDDLWREHNPRHLEQLATTAEVDDPRFRYRTPRVAKPPSFPSKEEWTKEFELRSSEAEYQNLLRIRKRLPAWRYRDEVISAVKENQVTIISGETGCGKSTQVPQFLLVRATALYVLMSPGLTVF